MLGGDVLLDGLVEPTELSAVNGAVAVLVELVEQSVARLSVALRVEAVDRGDVDGRVEVHGVRVANLGPTGVGNLLTQ